VGGAVARNRVKRLLREAFVREGARLPRGADVVLVARRDIRELAEREGLSGVRGRLAELISRVEGATHQDAGGDWVGSAAEAPE
jgi:ribonuclease P protein component